MIKRPSVWLLSTFGFIALTAALWLGCGEGDETPVSTPQQQIVLDRSGFGPKSTMDVNTTTIDLSELTREQLAERAASIASILRAKKQAIDVTPLPTTIQ